MATEQEQTPQTPLGAESANDKTIKPGRWKAADVVIDLCHHDSDQPCPICGKIVQSGVGPRLYLRGGSSPVCLQCGQERTPGIHAVLLSALAFSDIAAIVRGEVGIDRANMTSVEPNWSAWISTN